MNNTASEATSPLKKCQVDIFITQRLLPGKARDYLFISEANKSEHWTRRSKRITAQHKLVWYGLSAKQPPGSIELPCSVVITRYGTKLYDDDNLIAAMKHVRDATANFLKPGLAPGKADDDKRIKWTCLQVATKDKEQHGIRIEIY